MTTKHPRNKSTANAGVNFVKPIVEDNNSIFQQIDLDNDIGNDAYIEFTVGEEATGACIAVQIKSGMSYKNSDQQLFLKGDKDHFEYWNSHILPIAGIIFDPEIKRAAWCDVTEYLRSNPNAINDGPYNIPAMHPFSEDAFEDFKTHFLKYREKFNKLSNDLDANFGRALRALANENDFQGRMDAIKLLTTFYRQDYSSWHYLITSFNGIDEEHLKTIVAYSICHIPGHGDIYWHDKNFIGEDVRKQALKLISKTFQRNEVLSLLCLIDEKGIARGTIGQCVEAIINSLPDKISILETISFDESIEEDIRFEAFVLLLWYSQNLPGTSAKACIKMIDKHVKKFPQSLEILAELRRIYREFGYFSIY